jgi:hypothetical protein
MRTNTTATVLASALRGFAATLGRAGDARLGAQGGLSRSTLSVADLETGLETEWRSGYDAGLRFEVSITRGLALVVAPSVVERGGSIHEPAQDERLRLETRYFEVPVLLRLSGGGSVRPYLLAGASFAWRSDAQLSLEVQGEVLGSEDASDYVSGSDVLLQAGGGLDFEAGGRVRLFAEGLYSWGLRGLDAGDEGDFGFIDAKNRGFALRAGFTVRLGR